MGRAFMGSKSNFDEMQTAIDYLTCKAQAAMPFTSDDKEFLKELYESFSLGGSVKGFPEAAKLADHYVNGAGRKLNIDSEVYQTSVIVKDAREAIKNYIRQLVANKANFGTVKTSDMRFLNSPVVKPLHLQAGRSIARDGYLISTGFLLTEQNNERLQKANNRFVLGALTTRLDPSRLQTNWSVDDYYEFESFARAPYNVTNIPLSSFVLKVPDGLSHYMTVMGVAKAFDYSAKWTEAWNV